MARQGMVLKLNKKKMTVMTEDGEFLELPLPDKIPAPGTVVELEPTTRKATYPKVALVAALLIVVLGLSLFSPFINSRPVAAVALDLPVALELAVDAQNRVTGVKARDAAARALVEGLELRGKDIYIALDRVVQASCSQMAAGELAGSGQQAFVVTLMPVKGKGKMNLERQKLRDHLLQELEQQQFEGYLIVQDSEEDLREKARAAGLPVADYLVRERSGFSTLPTDALLSQDETQLERHFPGMWCRVGKEQPAGNREPMGHHRRMGGMGQHGSRLNH